MVGQFEPSELDKDDVAGDDPAKFLAAQIQTLPDPQGFIDALEAETLKGAQTADVASAVGTVFGIIRKIALPAL